jgi:hypothetical protein
VEVLACNRSFLLLGENPTQILCACEASSQSVRVESFDDCVWHIPNEDISHVGNDIAQSLRTIPGGPAAASRRICAVGRECDPGSASEPLALGVVCGLSQKFEQGSLICDCEMVERCVFCCSGGSLGAGEEFLAGGAEDEFVASSVFDGAASFEMASLFEVPYQAAEHGGVDTQTSGDLVLRQIGLSCCDRQDEVLTSVDAEGFDDEFHSGKGVVGCLL